MAVEARHLNLFPSQLLPNTHNRDVITNPNVTDANFINIYNNYSSLLPLSCTTTVSENLLPTQPPPYNPFITDSLQKTTDMKSDSTLTYNNNDASYTRKRSRDTISDYTTFPSYKNSRIFSFLGEDISQNIYHQNIDIDHLVSQHMDKMRMELEEKRKRQAKMLMELIEIGMIKKLKAKEEEMEKFERMNTVLEERVKSLCIENQIWRELAQTNEATATALRNNLEQVLTQLKNNGGGVDATVVAEEDAESSCGSNNYNKEGWCTVAYGAQDKENGEGTSGGGDGSRVMNEYDSGYNEKKRLCRNCGKGESCVLILPCRHLCLCTMCGSTLHTCPVCKCFKNATLLVNLS